MKKTIIKIAAATLLIGGLAFNFVANKSNEKCEISLKSIEASACTMIEGASGYWCECSTNNYCVNVGGRIYIGYLARH